MDFLDLAKSRYSCRSYDPAREVEADKLDKILEAARLSPSACNGQPYHITVCRGECRDEVYRAVSGMGMNRFAKDAPLYLIISEKPYVKSAALGAKLKNNDYRSIDIGILSAYITFAATELGLGSCILGWLDDAKIREACSLDGAARLVIVIGYPKEGKIPEKKRLSLDELVSEAE